jgi:chromosome partitioning protein
VGDADNSDDRTADTVANGGADSSAAPDSVTAAGIAAASAAAGSIAEEEARRAALAASIPVMDESTPLAQEIAENARRRIDLAGRRFPKPPRTRVLTVANQKGGVGKTTTTVNIAAGLAQAGLTVLVPDNDPQGNASTALSIDHHSEVPSLYDVLVEGMPLADVVQQCPDVPNLLCAPATIDLAGAEIELVSMVARETRLRRALDQYLDEREQQGLPRIDYVLVDCPPSLGLLTVNAFVVAREVLIPIQCEYYALEGLSQLLRNIELIRAHLNPELHVSTILLTMYDGRTRLAAQVAEEVRSHFPEVVLETTIPRSVRISEAPSHGQTVMTYDPGSSGALCYLSAARELAERGAAMAPATGQVPTGEPEREPSGQPPEASTRSEIDTWPDASSDNRTSDTGAPGPHAPDTQAANTHTTYTTGGDSKEKM